MINYETPTPATPSPSDAPVAQSGRNNDRRAADEGDDVKPVFLATGPRDSAGQAAVAAEGASDFDAMARSLFTAFEGSLLTDDEIMAGGGTSAPIGRDEVVKNILRIDRSNVLERIKLWRAEDRAGKRGGGRPPKLGDRAILVMSLLLMMEGTPILITELRNAFWLRLDDDARAALGIGHLRNTGNSARDAKAKYDRVWRSLHSLIDTFDAWPAPRRLMDLEERQRVVAERDSEMQRVKSERARWFTNALIEMTLRAQHPDLQKAWQGGLSADQSALKAPSQAKPWRRDGELPGRPEVPNRIKKTGELVRRPVMEVDATPYPIDKGAKNKEFTGNSSAFEHSYAANIFIMVTEPDQPLAHPQLIAAASLHRFGGSISEHTIAGVDSILDRGWPAKRLTVDRGYSGGMSVDKFHLPMAERGIGLVIDYNRGEKGVRKNTVGGALELEGALYCPALPDKLRTLTLDVEDDVVTPDTYYDLIEERRHYRLKPKEKPDERGAQPMSCPALGPSATVECPLRKLHPKATTKKTRPLIDEDLLPIHPDLICKQTSVKIERHDGIDTRQLLHYGSKEWHTMYKHDRNSMEGVNAYLKEGRERMREAGARRVRGLAAQNYVFTMMLVSANLRRLAKFMRDRAEGREYVETHKGRVSNYHRFYRAPEVDRGMTMKEKREAAKEKQKA